MSEITDTGQMAQLANRIVAILGALEKDVDTPVFKTVALWRHQISFDKAGPKNFPAYAPFAFVGYMRCNGSREGGYDLKQDFELVVLIGESSHVPGLACWGDATHLGTSRLRELVIAAVDQVHPGSGFESDGMEYLDEEEWVDNLTDHGIRQYYKVPSMAVTQPQE